MRLITPDKLREILDDPANSTTDQRALDLVSVCARINAFCAGPIFHGVQERATNKNNTESIPVIRIAE